MDRPIFSKILDFIDKTKTHSVLLIKGARQVGKTYAIDAVLDRIALPSIRLNLEKDLVFRDKINKCMEFDDFTFLLKSELGFKPDEMQVVFIDEVQESDKIGQFIRFMKEEWKNTKVILSGSSTTRLFKKGQRVPVGRFTSINLTPLTFEEYLRFLEKDALFEKIALFPNQIPSELVHNQLLEEYDKYLEIGGMPQVLESVKNGEDYRTVRTALILSQREDFISKTQIGDAGLFDECLSAVANHVGCPSKYATIGKSYHFAKTIMSIMINWLLVIEVERQGLNPNKSDYLPKRYIYDVGVLRHFQNRPFQNVSISDASQPDLRTHLGGIFENSILIALENKYFGQESITTWKQSGNSPHEVDFIVRSGDRFIPIECKAGLRVTNRAFKNVMRYLEISKQDTGYVVSAAPFSSFDTKDYKLTNFPVYMAERL